MILRLFVRRADWRYRALLAGGMPLDRVHCCDSPAAVAEFLRSYLEEGDPVLLRGAIRDRVERVFHAQPHEVRCWTDCWRKTTLCDECPELFGGEQPRRRPDVCLVPEQEIK